MDRLDILALLIFILSIGVIITIVHLNINDNNNLENKNIIYKSFTDLNNRLIHINNSIKVIERAKMCDGHIEEGMFLDGIYRQNEYYCVWTKDLTDLYVEDTEYHEACHHMIYNNWSHFCEGNTIK